MQKWEARIGSERRHPRLEIGAEGLVLGAGTVLAKSASDARGRPHLTIDEPRVMALLATAYGQPAAPYAVAKMRRAAELWNEGEKALAHIHLAYAGLPPCCEDETLRLFLAGECLAAGVTPAELMEAQAFDPALSKYSPDQPRVPAGSGRESGRWTSGGAGGGQTSVDPRAHLVTAGISWAQIRSLIQLFVQAWRRFHPEGKAPGKITAKPATSSPPRVRSRYDDITGRKTDVPNKQVDLTRSEFESNLLNSGWVKSFTKDGKGVIYSKNGTYYVVRDNAKSTKGPTVDFHHRPGRGNKADLKIRLRSN